MIPPPSAMQRVAVSLGEKHDKTCHISLTRPIHFVKQYWGLDQILASEFQTMMLKGYCMKTVSKFEIKIHILKEGNH